MYKITFTKTSKFIQNDTNIEINDFDISFEFEDFRLCLDKFYELCKEEFEHTISIDYTQIHIRLRMYNDNKIIRQIQANNF